MILVLFDKQQYIISKEQAEKIEKAVTSNAKFFKVDGDLIATSAVMAIKKGGEVLDSAPEDRQIEAPDYRGQESAAKEKVRAMLKEKGLL